MSKKLHQGAGANLFVLARQNRKIMTPAERRLWLHLRNRKFKGLKFRRQHPVANYIADFYCDEYNVVIELDGGYHISQSDYDRERDESLKSRGIQVIRFTNTEVLNDLEFVLSKIQSLISSTRGPSPEREGGDEGHSMG